MDLPDCPPGAEGYEDSVTEVPKKPDDPNCTKAEQEFQEHLNSLKIKLEDGTTRPMVERAGRDISGKWIYLCYPCAAVCSGENILQVHISGKKHKAKLALMNAWPTSIFDNHPYHQNNTKTSITASENVLQKMAQAVDVHNQTPCDLEKRFHRYRNVTCHLQEALDKVKAPLIGLEYLIEHPPEPEFNEPTYSCTLCSKQGQPRTIINHMNSFWHRYHYALRHFRQACNKLTPYRGQKQHREGMSIVINRLAQRIESTYGRMRPLNIDKEEYKQDKESIHQWIVKGEHFQEKEGCTFEEVADTGLIESLLEISHKERRDEQKNNQEPSPPFVAAPSKPHFNLTVRAPYKMILASDRCTAAEESALKTLAYHKKNPEKHPLYPEEWKKFWNKRYKEIQAEGKDPSKYDFKPEWKVFWTARMQELHDEELCVTVNEIYRKMCLSPPDISKKSLEPVSARQAPDLGRRQENLRHQPVNTRRRSPEPRRRSPEPGRRSPEPRRRLPEPRRGSPGPRRRSPESRRRSPNPRRRSPAIRHRSPDIRHRSPVRRRSPEMRRERRSPIPRRSPGRRRSSERRRSPIPNCLRTRSRSPIHRRSPVHSRIPQDKSRRSRSPLSQREKQARNRSPEHRKLAPSIQAMLISDDELKADDTSPYNSDNEFGSAASHDGRSHANSTLSRGSRGRARVASLESSAPDDVVATLRVIVALEDYLGSLGPKLVDLLGEALKMEKEEANSSEQLLVRQSATVLIETAKEKLNGAAQAGLVSGSAAAAARAAVVRAAATLHEADKRMRAAKQKKSSTITPNVKSAVPVASVGEVDRAQIAQQIAEALIAQGKTDVSSEELAQLVEAFVGMAEVKKRKQPDIQAESVPKQPIIPQKLSGTASALQMLQSAYDEHDKREAREGTPDAMDGLSDSDLETLLKNFYELSAEEQHSLIAYLKKLEARDPSRVERLRQYVSDAAHAPAVATAPRAAVNPPALAPAPRLPGPLPRLSPAPHPQPGGPALVLESDDDDYFVEEILQSATQKVKEDQIRQEMEIVKKSLETARPLFADDAPILDITRNLSSASNIFALVQASLKSTPTPTPAPIVQPPEVVSSNIQPRSFGDSPEHAKISHETQKEVTSLPMSHTQPSPLLRILPQNLIDNKNQPLPTNDQNNQGNQLAEDRFKQGNLHPTDSLNQLLNIDRFNHGSQQPSNNLNLGHQRFNPERFTQGNEQSDQFNKGNPRKSDLFNQGYQPPDDHFNQGNKPPNNSFNQGNQQPDCFNQGNPPPNASFNQGNRNPPSEYFNQPLDRFNQGNPPPHDRFNRGNQPSQDRFDQDNQPLNDRYNYGNQLEPNDRCTQGNQPPSERFTSGNPSPNNSFNQGKQPQSDNFHQGMQPLDQLSSGTLPDRFNRGNTPDRFNQGNPPDRFNQDNPQQEQGNQGNQWNKSNNASLTDNRAPLLRGPAPLLGLSSSGLYNPPDRFNQDNPQQEQGNQGNQWNKSNNASLTDNRAPLLRGPAPLLGLSSSGLYNQGPRPNFINNHSHDNRQMNQQQSGNYDNKNFLGRGGRGQGRGGQRGLGRGFY